jgi:soluble lytic murein transglycosylase-like protein
VLQQRAATFDHYAVALITCSDPNDALASHYATSHTKRRPGVGEKLSDAVARVELAFRSESTAAYGCHPAEAGRFWAL